MSQENVTLARRVLDALGRRDPEELVALLGSEVEWHSFFAPEPGRRLPRPRRDAPSSCETWPTPFEVGRAEVDDALGIDDVTPARGPPRTTEAGAAGRKVPTPAGWMLKFREGKLVRFQAFRARQRPSKPWGWRSRRCRRRTWSLCGVRSTTSMKPASRNGTSMPPIWSGRPAATARRPAPIGASTASGAATLPCAKYGRKSRLRSSNWSKSETQSFRCSIRSLRAQSGVELETAAAWVTWCRDGKIARIEQHGPRDEAFEAVGLSE